MKVQDYTPCPHGYLIHSTEGYSLRLEAWNAGILRFSYTTGDFPEQALFGDLVCGKPEGTPFTVSETDAEITFSTASAAVVIRRATFGIRLSAG